MTSARRDPATLTPEERRGFLSELLRKRAAEGRALPLSFAEERLWFLEQLEPGNPAYNIGVAGLAQGPLDLRALVSSFNEVVRRHEVLRSTYRAVDGRPVKATAPELRIRVPLTDVSAVPEGEWDDELSRLAMAEAREPFDLERGPLLRVRLLRRAKHVHVVLATVHHIVFDGWSTLVLLNELMALYGAFTSDQAAPLPELPIQYVDFARWQRRWLQGSALEELTAYWKQQLGGSLPTLDLPADRPRPAIQSYRGARAPVEIPPGLTAALKDLSRQAGVTLFMTLLAGFEVLLRYHTRQDDVIVGTDAANRTRAETESLIGFFVNELVFRSNLSGDPTCQELLVRVRQVCLGAYAHQELPFERLLQVLKPDRGRDRPPLFQVKLVLQNDWLPSAQVGGVTWRPMEIVNWTAKCDLFLSLIDRSDRLTGFIEYSTDLFDAPRVRHWFQQLEVLLAAMVANPEVRLSALERTLAAWDRDAMAQARRRLHEANRRRLLGATPAPIDAFPAEGHVPAGGARAFGLSPTQERIWRLAPQPHGGAYRGVCAAIIQGALRTGDLLLAIDRAVERHDALRTMFRCTPGSVLPCQVVVRASKAAVEVVDVTDADADQQERALDSARRRAQESPIDLEQDSSVRATVIVYAPDRHALVLGVSALCADATSLDILMRDIAATCAGRAPDGPPVQYPTIAEWQRDMLADETVPAMRLRWPETGGQRRLVDELPLERRGAGDKYDPAAVRRALGPALAAQITALAERCGVAPFVVLLACWQALLWKLSGDPTILVGLRADGRRFPELAATVGPLERYVPVVGEPAEGTSFVDLVARVQDAAAVALDWQEHVAPLAIEGESGGDVGVGFAYDGRPRRFNAGHLSLEIVSREAWGERVALELRCGSLEDEFAVEIRYDAGAFHDDDVARLGERLEQLLRSALATPEAPIGELELVGAAERQEVVVGFNQTAVAWPLGRCLHELVEQQVERTPDRCAVVFGSERLTYAALNARANQLARHLRRFGVGPEVLVGICVERSFDLVIGLLGILKAGGAYVPLDPTCPRERLAFMAADAAAPVVLTRRDALPILGNSRAHRLYLDADWSEVARELATDLAPTATPDNLVYVIYTSGSTGQPKGAMNTHRGVCNRLLWMQQVYGLTAADRVLQKTPFSFDVSVWEFFWPLLTGARLVLAPPGGHRDSAGLVDLIVREGITTAHFVPSMLRVFLEEKHVDACTSLRRVICSGEALATDLPERFFSRLSAELHNLYGPTEAAVDVTAWACERGAPGQSIPIGRPIANTQTYLLDTRLRPVPVGVPGELHIGGVQVGRGYLNRPALTAQKFIPDPFSCTPGARLYRTGDLSRWRRDGAIEFLGRLDHQIKIRGFRIELGEIEAVLLRHPGVRDAVVHARETGPEEKRLVAYLVPSAAGEPVRAGELRTFLKEQLPEYMVPPAFVQLSALPRSPNGKVDRSALPAPHPDVERPVFVAPRDDIEARLARIWEECLDLRRVGISDDFFELGGHSLLAVRLLARVQAELDWTLPLSSLFEATTVQAQAALLREPASAAPGTALVAIQPRGSKPPFFCVHPAGGHALCYVPLARALGSARPFYGLQARGLDGVSTPHARVEEMAAAYVEAVRGRQPDGPYFLGGSSFGGVVAFEMAHQLRSLGQEVAVLALLDTLAPLPGNLPGDIDPVTRLHSIVGTITRFVRQTLMLPVDEVARLDVEQQIDYLLAAARRANLLPPGCDRELINRIVEIHKLNFLALQCYAAEVYPGPLTVFRAAETSPDTLEPVGARHDAFLGWSSLSRHPVEVVQVPGDHMTMLTNPHVTVLADRLRRLLGDATTFSEPTSPLVAPLANRGASHG